MEPKKALYSVPLWILLAGVGLLIFGSMYVLDLRRSLDAEERHSLLLTANVLSSDHENAISGIEQFLVALQRTAFSSSTCDTLLREMAPRYPYFLNIGVMDPGGTITCSGIPQGQNVSAKNDADFLAMKKSGEFTISNYRISSITGRPSVRFLQPVYKGDTLFAVLFVTFGLEWLNAFSDPAILSPDTTVVKFDTTGTVFMRYPDPTVWTGTEQKESELFTTIQKNTEGYAEIVGLDQKKKLFYFMPIHQNGHIHGYVAVGKTL